MKLERNINVSWELRGYSDTDYAGDNINWKSMTEYFILINGAVIPCSFQSQETASLSVTEAEYSAITRHIDVHHRFICDYFEYRKVKIKFVHSKGNYGRFNYKEPKKWTV